MTIVDFIGSAFIVYMITGFFIWVWTERKIFKEMFNDMGFFFASIMVIIFPCLLIMDIGYFINIIKFIGGLLK